MRRFLRAGVLGGATALAACAGNPPVSPMDEIPIRAPIPSRTCFCALGPTARFRPAGASTGPFGPNRNRSTSSSEPPGIAPAPMRSPPTPVR